MFTNCQLDNGTIFLSWLLPLPLPFTAWEITSMSSTISIVLLRGPHAGWNRLVCWGGEWDELFSAESAKGTVDSRKDDRIMRVFVLVCVCVVETRPTVIKVLAARVDGLSWWLFLIPQSCDNIQKASHRPLQGHQAGILGIHLSASLLEASESHHPHDTLLSLWETSCGVCCWNAKDSRSYGNAFCFLLSYSLYISVSSSFWGESEVSVEYKIKSCEIWGKDYDYKRKLWKAGALCHTIHHRWNVCFLQAVSERATTHARPPPFKSTPVTTTMQTLRKRKCVLVSTAEKTCACMCVTLSFLFLFPLRPDITGKTQDEIQNCLRLFFFLYTLFLSCGLKKNALCFSQNLTRRTEQSSLAK